MKKYYHVLVFIIGIIATICYRLVIVLNDYGQFWVKLVWYIGTISYIWYFAHRYIIEARREKLVENLQLEEKIKNGVKLSEEETKALGYILKGLRISLARWNYIVIFVASFIAMTYAIWVDLK